MTELLTAAQMRAIEQAAIERGEVTGVELMERAGRGVVDAVFEEWPELAQTSHKSVILCGPGNNGGDGFVVARLLKEWGWEVEVFFYGDVGKLPPDARVNYERWEVLGKISELSFPEVTKKEGEFLTNRIYGNSGCDLLVDGFFGTGLTRPIEGLQPFLETNDLYATFSDLMPVRTVAIDIPSGICADSGRRIRTVANTGMPWAAVQADLTVPFHRQKLGHLLSDGPAFCGTVRVKEIGLSEPEDSGVVRTIDPELDGYTKPVIGHKYNSGHALILTGRPGKTGAARLAARGALRIGAGVVTLGVPPSAQMEVAGHITAVMLTRVADGDALGEVLQDTRINALCLGPGLGLERARELVPVACGGVKPRRTVLDADALSAYADDPEALFELLHQGCVLTPHGGEFARLFPDIAARLGEVPTSGPAYSKVDATRDAAKRAGCVVLFKGPDTVIASPDGRCSINSAHYERAAPWLATAGSGDVLAGFITGLLARGFAPMPAAETAAWLHVQCALEFGPGLIAEDIPETLPKVFRNLGL